MPEVKFTSHTTCSKKVFLVSKDTPLKVVQDTLLEEGTRLYGHYANGMLSDLDGHYELEFINKKIDIEEFLDNAEEEVIESIAEELNFKEDEFFDEAKDFILEEIYGFFYKYFVSQRDGLSSVFDTKDNRVEISEMLLNYTGEPQEVPLKMVFSINELIEDFQTKLPKFAKIITDLNIFDTLKKELKEIQEEYPPFTLRISPEEVIVRL